MRLHCVPRQWRWPALLLAGAVVASPGALAQQPPGGAGPPPPGAQPNPNGAAFGIVPNRFQVRKLDTRIPGNSWSSILKLPPISGIAWAEGMTGLARAVDLAHISYPPFKPMYLAQSQAEVRRILAGTSEFVEINCKPMGLPRLIYYKGAPAFFFAPGVTAIIEQGVVRQVNMDGSGHPRDYTDPQAVRTYDSVGHSIGHWEGKTLVVDTVGINPDTELYYGVPNGGGMHMIERYEYTGPGMLHLHLTVEAPAVLEKPWVLDYNYRGGVGPPLNLHDDECDPSQSREKLDDQGNATLDLTPPPPAAGSPGKSSP